MFNLSLQQKFIIALLGVSTAIIVVTSFFAERTAADLLEEETRTGVQKSVSDFTEKATTSLSRFEKMIDFLVQSQVMKGLLEKDDKAAFINRKSNPVWEYYRKNVMDQLVDVDKESIRLYYVGSTRHKENYRHNDTSYVDYDATSRIWYKEALTTNGYAFSSYLSHDKKKIDVTISKKIEENGKLLGVAGIDILTENIFKDLHKKSSDSTTYIFVIDNSGRLIYHPNPEYLLKNISDSSVAFSQSFLTLCEQMLKNQTGTGDFVGKSGEEFIFNYSTIGNTNWVLGWGVKKSVIDEPINALIIKMISIDSLILIVMLIIAWFITREIFRPIRNILSAMRNIAEGRAENFKKIEINSSDEIGELAGLFNQFSESIFRILTMAKMSGVEIASLSKALNEAMAQLNSAAVEQSAAVAETTSAMEEMYQMSSKIAEGANSIVDIAGVTQSTAKSGVDKVNNLIKNMEEIERINQHRTQDIVLLNKKVVRITEVMGMIRDINEQTKLIAFNAALEASGAGESGKRFSVVASEIRRLADTVQESMEEIRLMIDEIKSQTELLLKSTDQSTNIVLEGVLSSREMEESFKQIYMGTRNTTDSSQQNMVATSQQKTASEQIVSTLHDISEAVNHVVNMSAEVRMVAEQLQTLSNDFKEMDLAK